MLFKDHLKIVTDAGAVLHLGWDYDAPYLLDPLNGADVDLQTAQGVNQVGDTVEGQSVSGVSRTLSVVFWGRDALTRARAFTKKLPYFTKGTLYFGDHYFTRFVLQKLPYFSSYTPDPRCELMLYSEKPFWYDLNAAAYDLYKICDYLVLENLIIVSFQTVEYLSSYRDNSLKLCISCHFYRTKG